MSGPGPSAAIQVTVETELDDQTAEDYYALYRETFGELETRAVARQLLHHDEFMAEMRDPRVQKYVARRNGLAVGMSTLTNQLETVPWISPAYFAHHYPDHVARGAVYYIGFTLVHRDHRRSRAFPMMIERIGAVLAEADAVVGWDICAFNDDDRSFGVHASRALGRTGNVLVAPVDRQTYYVGTFASGADAPSGTGAS